MWVARPECARPRAVDLRRRRNARRNPRRNARGVSDARDRARGRVASTTTDSCAPSGRRARDISRTILFPWYRTILTGIRDNYIVQFRDDVACFSDGVDPVPSRFDRARRALDSKVTRQHDARAPARPRTMDAQLSALAKAQDEFRNAVSVGLGEMRTAYEGVARRARARPRDGRASATPRDGRSRRANRRERNWNKSFYSAKKRCERPRARSWRRGNRQRMCVDSIVGEMRARSGR